MTLLSIIVRQAQYSGDRNITSQYCTYVSLTLDRCKTTTIMVKGHNPHWEQDYLFETQSTSRGLLIEVWKQDNYSHTSMGCYWLPLNIIRYSNEHTVGLWASLGKELYVENGLIIKSINSTGHFLLYDARLEEPDEDRKTDNDKSEDIMGYYYDVDKGNNDHGFNNNNYIASTIKNQKNEWYKHENDEDKFRSSSSENMQSDLDYSYSDASKVDHHSCYESSEKSLEKREQYSKEYGSLEYSDDTSYNQKKIPKDSKKLYNKRIENEGQLEADDQWVSDECTDDAIDEIYQNSPDYDEPPENIYNESFQSTNFQRYNSKKDSYEEDNEYEDDVDEDLIKKETYCDNQGYDNYVYVDPAPSGKKRMLPAIPSFDSNKHQNYNKVNYSSKQFKDEHISNNSYRVPSIYGQNNLPSLIATKNVSSASFEYQDEDKDDSCSIYGDPNNLSPIPEDNINYNYYDTSKKLSRNDSFVNRRIYKQKTYDEEYKYDIPFRENNSKYKNDDDREEICSIEDYNDDDINNNVTNRNNSIQDFPETSGNKSSNFPSFPRRPSFNRQSQSFADQFEWTVNTLPFDEDYKGQSNTSSKVNDMDISAHDIIMEQDSTIYYNPVESIIEEEDYEKEDVPFSSLPGILHGSQEKDFPENYENSVISSYEKKKSIPEEPNVSGIHLSDKSENLGGYYHRKSIIELPPNLQKEMLLKESQDVHSRDCLEVISDVRKLSVKDENSIEMRKIRARNRWHNAYNKIVHQLNVSCYHNIIYEYIYIFF